MNYYELLNVKPTASKAEIKAAYKSLIKKYHPDIYKGDKTFAERKTKEINTAFDVLEDPAKRAEYDASIAPKVNYNDYYSNYNTTSSRYNTYGTASRARYSEPSKYSPYSNRRKQAQAEQYKSGVKASSNASYTEKVIFNVDDFKLFRDSLNNRKTANIVILGFLGILFVFIFVIISTFSQLNSFYSSSNSYIERKREFRNNFMEEANDSHPRHIYSNPDVKYYVAKGDSYEMVQKYLGAPDKEKYEYDYLFWYYDDSYVVFELTIDYEVVAFHDLGELVSYYD